MHESDPIKRPAFHVMSDEALLRYITSNPWHHSGYDVSANRDDLARDAEKLFRQHISHLSDPEEAWRQIGPKYKPGDFVCWTNDYGVAYHATRILRIEDPDKFGFRYYVAPNDADWCPVREENLHFETLSLAELEQHMRANPMLQQYVAEHPEHLKQAALLVSDRDEKRCFWAFKQSVDGNQDRWAHVRNLTRGECADLSKFPPGTLRCTRTGRDYAWAYALMPELDLAIKRNGMSPPLKRTECLQEERTTSGPAGLDL